MTTDTFGNTSVQFESDKSLIAIKQNRIYNVNNCKEIKEYTLLYYYILFKCTIDW